jgi:hypothetical protein
MENIKLIDYVTFDLINRLSLDTMIELKVKNGSKFDTIGELRLEYISYLMIDKYVMYSEELPNKFVIVLKGKDPTRFLNKISSGVKSIMDKFKKHPTEDLVVGG